jgi:acetyltransferase-like isoleucine patch superfamily enzyme
MKRPSKAPGSAIVWAGRRPLRAFYRAGELHPALAQAPHDTAMATARSAVAGEVLLVGDLAPGFTTGAASSGGRGLGSALRRLDLRRLKGDRIVLIDASACFISPATVAALLRRLPKADLAGIKDSGAAVAMTRRVLAWLLRNETVAAGLADLWRGLQRAATREQWKVATLPPVGNSEQPIRDAASLYACAREHRLAAALRLADAGLGLRDPERLDLRGKLTFGRNVFIDTNVAIIGDVHLGNGVTIGPNCIVEDSRILAGATIKEFSLVTGAVVGAGCRVGPFARLRPGTRLGDGCQIGNFVEVKNARFGRNCKINHHSFVGDATLGDGVIMGAGSMTCNFDGTKSNVTRIRDKAFIGSGVMLVAPVTVERNAFVGAGSTLVAKAPADSLTLARAKQITIRNWKKK